MEHAGHLIKFSNSDCNIVFFIIPCVEERLVFFLFCILDVVLDVDEFEEDIGVGGFVEVSITFSFDTFLSIPSNGSNKY